MVIWFYCTLLNPFLGFLVITLLHPSLDEDARGLGLTLPGILCLVLHVCVLIQIQLSYKSTRYVTLPARGVCLLTIPPIPPPSISEGLMATSIICDSGVSSQASMAQAAEEASKSTLQDLVLRSIKRTYDMFSSDGTAVLPSFLPR